MELITILNRCHRFRGFVYQYAHFSADKKSIEVVLRPRKGSAAVCSRCHLPAPGYDQRAERRFEFIPLWGFFVFLLYTMRRVDCRRCGVVAVEEVPWGDGKRTVTKAYMLFLARWARRLSWKETAECFRTSWDKVFDAVEHVVAWGLEHRTLGQIDAIGVDEIQYAKGHKYLTLVYQIDIGVTRLLWVGRERTIESFQGFFTTMGQEVISKISFICSDMWEPYLKVIQEKCSEALHILDRFHIVAKMNKALDEVRAEETRRMKREGRDPLRDRAVALGWPLERIHVLDSDLGKSGSQATGRDGFQRLVSEVALGKAGMVMGLEVSRLARNSADWHRLIELCSLAGALILDEDGIYDPANFNDRLLLGLKGTMSEAELHFLKARMRGGAINKARRGELEMRPPVGLVYRDDGALVLDPDTEVQAAIRLVFETFSRTGSAMQTVKVFHEQGVLFPRRIRQGVDKGDLHWVKAGHSRIIQILHNPRYAGAFVYGRVRTRRLPDGTHSTTKVPRSDWQFVIPGIHAGYISWEQFETNQKRLADNALGFGEARKAGPAREGPALLQGRVICGICGERMGVRYSIAYRQLAPTYICQEASVRRGEKVCQHVPGSVVDRAVSDLLLELMQPMTLEVALAVQQEVESRITETDALRQKHVDRARYDAELARRRYMKVDPDNRLVADSLEAEWNNKLRSLAEAQEQYERQTQKQRLLIDSQTREQLLSLATDFPRLWSDPAVEPRERKRILRLLVEDVTLIHGERIQVHVRLRGGATRSLTLAKPLPIAQIRKTKPDVVVEIDALLDHYCDREVADILNQRGRRTWQNEPFNLKKIAHIRQAFNLKCRYSRLRARGLLTAKEMSVRHGVTTTTINLWAREGRLQKHRYDNVRRCLYEPLSRGAILKGRGGRRPKQPTFTVAQAG